MEIVCFCNVFTLWCEMPESNIGISHQICTCNICTILWEKEGFSTDLTIYELYKKVFNYLFLVFWFYFDSNIGSRYVLPKLSIIWLPNLLILMKVILNVPDEGYSRNVSRALNLISTFLFDDIVTLIFNN